MSEYEPVAEAAFISDLEVLSTEECFALLVSSPIGRIAIVIDGQPLVFPVNFRLVARLDEEPVIVIRTRHAGLIAQGQTRCAFQCDAIDMHTHTGWSVLVQGTLRELNPINPDVPHGWLDPEPWADEAERTKWLLIVPTAITGRRLSASNAEWAFSVHAYL